MAAMLTEIKSRMLLPARPTGEVGEDPRAELGGACWNTKMKYAAHKLDELRMSGATYLVQVYWSAWRKRLPQSMSATCSRPGSVWRAPDQRHHRISRQELSVRDT